VFGVAFKTRSYYRFGNYKFPDFSESFFSLKKEQMSRTALTKLIFTASTKVDRSQFNKCQLTNGNHDPVEIGFTNANFASRSSYYAHQVSFKLDPKQFKHLQEIYLHVQKQCELPDVEWKPLVTNPEYPDIIWVNWPRQFSENESKLNEMSVEVEVYFL
jgi:hypothetical protein